MDILSPQHLQRPSRLIAFRCDASLQIGSGHVMRCLTLAEALREQDAECHFLCREHEGHLCELIEARGFRVHRLPLLPANGTLASNDATGKIAPALAHAHWLGTSQEEDAEQTVEAITHHSRELFRHSRESGNPVPDWLIVDHYALDSRWELAVFEGLREANTRLLVIDDLADRNHIADLLLDQNLGRQVEDYDGLVPEHCQVLVGPRYALLRPEFAEWREASLARRARQPQFKKLLINLGGVDKDNVTGRVLEALKSCDLPGDASISVVMGATAPWLEKVKTKATELPWPTEVVVNVNDMARRMAEADLAIGAAGSTSWERCCLGLPSLMIVLAENQRDIALNLERSNASLTLNGDDLPHSLISHFSMLTCSTRLAAMSRQAASMVGGEGVSHLLVSMQEPLKVAAQ